MFKLLLCGLANFVVIATFAKTSLYVAKLKCTSVKFLGSGNRYTCKVPAHHPSYCQIQGVCFSGRVIYNPVKS